MKKLRLLGIVPLGGGLSAQCATGLQDGRNMKEGRRQDDAASGEKSEKD